jgi:MerR family transcriptional regulator, copper efflux regulator
MLIGELSQLSHTSRDTIRYYEMLGLLSSTRCSSNNYRHYEATALQRLHHISKLKETGFTLQEIGALLKPTEPQAACSTLPAQLARKISKFNAQITDLRAKRDALLAVATACSADCVVIAGLPSCLGSAVPTQSSACC